MSKEHPGEPGPWSRPAFQRGHALRRTHGADHEGTIEERATEVRAHLEDLCPWLAADEYAPAVARFLRAEARALILHDHIEATVASHGAGKVASRVWEQATAADRLAAQLGNVLGLDPLGRAKLQALTAGAEVQMATLADLSAQGRAARLAAEERMAAVSDAVASPGSAAHLAQEPTQAAGAVPAGLGTADGRREEGPSDA